MTHSTDKHTVPPHWAACWYFDVSWIQEEKGKGVRGTILLDVAAVVAFWMLLDCPPTGRPFPAERLWPCFLLCQSSMLWAYRVCCLISQDISFKVHTVLQWYFIMSGNLQCCFCSHFISGSPMFTRSIASETHGPNSTQEPGQVLAKWVGLFSLMILSFPILSLILSLPHWYLEYKKDMIQSTENHTKFWISGLKYLGLFS